MQIILLAIASFRPEFAGSIFGKLTNEKYPIREIDWKTWLDLAVSLFKEPLKEPEQSEWERDYNWAETCRLVVRFVRIAVENEGSKSTN